MIVTWVSQFCHAVKSPETTSRYRSAAVAILMIPLIQLLVAPLQIQLDSNAIELPASILVMLLVTITMLIANSFYGKIGAIYATRMKGPTDFLGRHMSLGFVVSFVMLSKDHITDPLDVPRIAAAFVFTTLLSCAGSYLFAIGGYMIDRRARGLIRRHGTDIEKASHQTWTTANSSRRPSQTSKLEKILNKNETMLTFETSPLPSSSAWSFLVRTAPLWLALFFAVAIGTPVYCAMDYDMPFETFAFLFFWIGAVYFQRFIKSWKRLELRPRSRSILSVALNPVLVTAVFGTAYFWIKAAVTQRNITDTLTPFKRHRSWADLITHLSRDGLFAEHVGAGDLANALLDAGIVSLGFKMFEYRRELWSGFTVVLSTCLVFSTLNIFINVTFAGAMGLQAAEALAFCARNVTIALGVPAVSHLGGSTTLMSALVTFSGMLFQMTGDFLFTWLRVNDQELLSNHSIVSSFTDAELETEVSQESERKTIAAGVAVGINAAAMGTSHLIERDSKCAAYSALSMTIFGALTVALTAVPAIARVLIGLAGQ
ncbi:hypothetical protein KJ359_005066 [Pestalotiopsis sp. 9143b]|nr:hypothetical protein KJ359_005066 [Pestalotiopsis sp. 9143b]